MKFLQSCNPGFAKEVVAVKNDIAWAYLSDIFAKSNALNLSLHGNEVNLIQVKSALSGFKNKACVVSAKFLDVNSYGCPLSSLQQLIPATLAFLMLMLKHRLQQAYSGIA